MELGLCCGNDKARKNRLEKRYRKLDVQELLDRMFSGKCAYCESKIGVVDYGHIEHFRPKQKYPERMYIWKNMVLSCTKCNGKEFKGTKFPSKAEGGPLINPCVDEPAKHFDFVYNPTTREARILPLTPRGEVTERVLGLNRSKLLVERSNHLRVLIYLRLKADSDQEAKDLIQKALDCSGCYLAFVNKYVDK